MSETSYVYFQSVNERAVHLEIDRVSLPIVVDLGHSKPLISLVVRLLSTTGVFMNENPKGFGEQWFFSIFVKFLYQDLKGHL